MQAKELPTVPQALNVAQVAERLAVSELTVRRMLTSGRLPGYKVGKLWRVDSDRLEQFIANTTNTVTISP